MTEPTGSTRPKRLATQGYITYPGSTTQERATLLRTLQLLLDDDNHPRRRHLYPIRRNKIVRQLNDNNITLAELLDITTHVITPGLIQKPTDNTSHHRYSKEFLEQFDPTQLTAKHSLYKRKPPPTTTLPAPPASPTSPHTDDDTTTSPILLDPVQTTPTPHVAPAATIPATPDPLSALEDQDIQTHFDNLDKQLQPPTPSPYKTDPNERHIRNTILEILKDEQTNTIIAENILAAQQKQTTITDILSQLTQQDLQWRQQLEVTRSRIEYQTQLNHDLTVANQETEKLRKDSERLNKQQQLLNTKISRQNDDNTRKIEKCTTELSTIINNMTANAIQEHKQNLGTIQTQQLAKYEGDVDTLIRQNISKEKDTIVSNSIKRFQTDITDIEQQLVPDLDAYPALAQDELTKWWHQYQTTTLPKIHETIHAKLQVLLDEELGSKQDPQSILGKAHRRIHGLCGTTISAAQRELQNTNHVETISQAVTNQLTKDIKHIQTEMEDNIVTKLSTKYPGTPSNTTDPGPHPTNNKPTLFPALGNTLEERIDSFEKIQSKERIARETKARSDLIQNNLRHFRNDVITSNLANAQPTQAEIEGFYQQLATTLQVHHIPIIPLRELTPIGTTQPPNEPIDPALLPIVKTTIFQKLQSSIPTECIALHQILRTFQSCQDGYAALYSIMQNYCSYLRIVRPTWGPQWKPHHTGFEYLTELQIFLDDQQRNNKTYTKYEIAAEIIQQANTHDRYKLIATNLLTGLRAYQHKEVPPEYTSYALVSTFEANKQSIPQPSIHKTQGPATKSDNRQRRRFQYKRDVQCTACHGYGHDTDQDICRYAAQHYYANLFCTKHPEKAKTNAQAYHSANNKKQINKLHNRFPEIFDTIHTEEEHDQTILDLACILTQSDDE